LQGLPLYATEEVRETQKELVLKLRYAVGCTPEQYESWVVPVVNRYTAYVHLLPASESHHHRGAGGLLHHGLEVAFLAGQASGGKVFAMDREPKVRRIHEPLWRLAATLAGLCHDIGKPLSDLSVTDRDGTCTWSPMQETISAWAAGNRIDSYYLHWRDRQHNRHELAGMMMLQRILGPDTIALLYGHDAAIMNALIDAVGGQKETATLTQLVANADRASVERDLKTNRIDPQAHSLGVPIERYLIDAMCRLVRDGTWRINTPGARLWMFAEGLHVVWPQGGDEIATLLAADRVPGIPRHPDTLADILIERGSAVAPNEGDGVRRYWRLAPALLAGEGKPVTLTMLRLSSPGLVLSGPVPEAAAVFRDATVRAMVPSQVPPQGPPTAGHGAHAERRGGNASDLADADDPAQWDSSASEAVAPEPWMLSGVDADLVGPPRSPAEREGAGTPTSAPANRDLRTSLEPPTEPPILDAQPLDPGGPSPRAPRSGPPAGPRTSKSAEALTPDPATHAGMLARTWFQDSQRGPGGRLLLNLAEAIRQGERIAADLLYVPAGRVWVRVPQGLEGFGAAVEEQLTALWDGGLLKVDIMQPYVRVHAIDGVRGVSLTAEASGYFTALLTPEVLACCVTAGTAATLLAPAVTLAPQPEPRPAQTPTVLVAAPASITAPTAAALSPTPTDTPAPSPSVMADALLARLRAEHGQGAAGGAGEGSVALTAADLAAAATAAGIKVKSLRLALMTRNGCRITDEGGLVIEIAP
jgi:conjugal transfer pilus assembly protein TraI